MGWHILLASTHSVAILRILVAIALNGESLLWSLKPKAFYLSAIILLRRQPLHKLHISPISATTIPSALIIPLIASLSLALKSLAFIGWKNAKGLLKRLYSHCLLSLLKWVTQRTYALDRYVRAALISVPLVSKDKKSQSICDRHGVFSKPWEFKERELSIGCNTRP